MESVSLRELYSPNYRKKISESILNCKESSKNESTLSFSLIENFNTLNESINSLSISFQKRLKEHESDILKVAHAQIIAIQKECSLAVSELNKRIIERNINNEIWDLKYQIKFYQIKASELYEENIKLKQEVKDLEYNIKEIKLGLFCEHRVLQKMSHKYLKEKNLRKSNVLSLSSNITSKHEFQNCLLENNTKEFLLETDHKEESKELIEFNTPNPEKKSKKALFERIKTVSTKEHEYISEEKITGIQIRKKDRLKPIVEHNANKMGTNIFLRFKILSENSINPEKKNKCMENK